VRARERRSTPVRRRSGPPRRRPPPPPSGAPTSGPLASQYRRYPPRPTGSEFYAAPSLLLFAARRTRRGQCRLERVQPGDAMASAVPGPPACFPLATRLARLDVPHFVSTTSGAANTTRSGVRPPRRMMCLLRDFVNASHQETCSVAADACHQAAEFTVMEYGRGAHYPSHGSTTVVLRARSRPPVG
jgi:hypothetical protein